MAFRLLNTLRTALTLAARVNELEDQWDEVQLVLADRLDKVDRLIRQLTVRASRSADLGPRPPVEGEPANQGDGPGTERGHSKERLRALARERGFKL